MLRKKQFFKHFEMKRIFFIFSRFKSFALTGRVFLPETGNSAHAQRASARALGKGGAGAGLYRSSYIPTYTVLLREEGGAL
jgi:hypothetical protein